LRTPPDVYPDVARALVLTGPVVSVSLDPRVVVALGLAPLVSDDVALVTFNGFPVVAEPPVVNVVEL